MPLLSNGGHFIFVLKHVSKIYGSKADRIAALNDVSFSLPSNGIVAIVGKSGSGKSTLLNLLSLLTKPSRGKILFLGKDLASFSEKEKLYYRNKVCGFVYQKFNLLEKESALNNIRLPLLIRGCSKVEAKEKALSLLTKFSLLPIQNREVSSLSGGEKQRVAILRAIVSDPEVLFCDEPTGALDERNSELTMELLKEISKERLVVLVSHNLKLVEQYCTYKIMLSDGEIIDKPADFICDKVWKKSIEKRGRSSWKMSLIFHHLKEDKRKNFLSFLSNAVAMTFLFCAIGFIYGSDESLAKEKEKSLLLYQASITKKERYELPNSPLSLTRSFRPDKEEFLETTYSVGISVHNDYSYFFPKETSFSSNKIASHASFEPIFDFSLKELGKEWLINKTISTVNESQACYVNDVFYKRFSLQVGDKIHVPLKTTITLDDKSFVVDLTSDFLIGGVVEEFGFLNLPRVYYSYSSFEERLKNTYAKSLSFRKSVFSIVEDSEGEEPYSSYSYLLYAHDNESKEKLFSLARKKNNVKEGLEYSSYSCSIIDSFDSLHKAISGVLVPFLFLALFASSFIGASISFSSFLERKKEAAILTSLGASFSSVISLYASESLFISLLSTLFSLFFSYFVELLLNPVLFHFSLIPNLIQVPFLRFFGIPLLFPLLALALSSLLSFFATFLPLIAFKRSTLLKELNDE